MTKDDELAIVRHAYAKQVLAAVQLDDERLEAAFATVRREDFLGPGPWIIPRWRSGFTATPSGDPVYLYVDTIVQIVGEKHINNGQPSGHAIWLASADIREGQHVVHIGSGTGYYTAIMAHLTGSSGRVTAIEIDPSLAEKAQSNLAGFDNVRVLHCDGLTAPFDTADVIYVNAGVTAFVDLWLEKLAEGGRLILPLTTDSGFMNRDPSMPIERAGGMFLIQRSGSEFLARWITPVAIIPCEGARDSISEAALVKAFDKGGWRDVTHLRRSKDLDEETCWLRYKDWCLTTA